MRNKRVPDGTPVGVVFGEAVRRRREAHHLTQATVAELMRTAFGFDTWTGPTVARVEGNQRGVGADELIGLSVVLTTSVADLLIGDKAVVRVGNLDFPADELRDHLTQSLYTLPPERVADLPLAARMAAAGDTSIRDQIEAEMADWAEAMRLLRKPVTEASRRAELAKRWAEHEQAERDMQNNESEDR